MRFFQRASAWKAIIQVNMKMCAREPFKSAVYKGVRNCRNGLPGPFHSIVRWARLLWARSEIPPRFINGERIEEILFQTLSSPVSAAKHATDAHFETRNARGDRETVQVRTSNVERHSILLSLDDVFTVHSHCRSQKYMDTVANLTESVIICLLLIPS